MSTNLVKFTEKLQELASQVDNTKKEFRSKLSDEIRKSLKTKSLPENTSIEAPDLDRVVIKADDEPIVTLKYSNGIVVPEISARNLNALHIIGKTFSNGFTADGLLNAFLTVSAEYLTAIQDDRAEIQAVEKHIKVLTEAETAEKTKETVQILLSTLTSKEPIKPLNLTHLRYKYAEYLVDVSEVMVTYQKGRTWIVEVKHGGVQTFNKYTSFDVPQVTSVGVSEKYIQDFLLRAF